MTRLLRPIVGVCAAIAITATMDAHGLSAFSALPLFPLCVSFWFWERFPRSDVGLAWGAPRDYALALLYPLIVIGAVVLLSAAAGAIDVRHTDWRKAGLNLGLMTIATILVAIVTEEGFFRGWLWASLGRVGLGPTSVLIWSSVAFSLWHLSSVVLDTGFNPPSAQAPVLMVNAFVIGVIWGLQRSISGSIIVSSVSHGLWNGLAYVLFGFGAKVGALGVANTAIFGPEVGAFGLALNAIFAGALFWWWRARRLGRGL